MTLRAAAALVLLASAGTSAGQERVPAQAPSESNSPSGGEISRYLGRAGRTFAHAAELDHLPPSIRVLERADELRLDAEQRTRIKQLIDVHQADATRLAAKLIQAEQALDAHLRMPQVEQAALAEAVKRAVQSLTDYLAVHQETDRRMRALLTAEQAAHFDELRGHPGAVAQPRKYQPPLKDQRSIK